jgi:hypothetical protein
MSMMRILVLPALFAAGMPLAQAQNVSFNATISGQVVPGVYGQVAIGNGPPPQVVYAQPVIVQPAPVIVGAAPVEPIYLHVPPGHAKNWRKHCHEYHACERPVYFVRSAEYEPGYRPDERDHHEHGRHDDDREDHDHGHHHDD